MATHIAAQRRGLPRVAGGEPWPPSLIDPAPNVPAPAEQPSRHSERAAGEGGSSRDGPWRSWRQRVCSCSPRAV